MALEGTLRDFSFADILQLISLQRKTGILTLKRAGEVVTISFLEGKIVGSDALSQRVEDRLGLILLRTGGITEDQLEWALEEQERSLKRLGRILVEREVVDTEAVRAGLEQQILQLVYRVFRWTDGEYHFSQEMDIDYDRELVIPMAADSVIMEGARMTDEWPFIEQRIPDRDVVFTKTDPRRPVEVDTGEAETFGDFELTFTETPDEPEEGQDPSVVRLGRVEFMVYELVSGRETVTEIVRRSPYLEFETCKALADMLDAGLIREATPAEVARQLELETLAETQDQRTGVRTIPWLAVPFLALLGFSLALMPQNPLNPLRTAKQRFVDQYVLESVSRFRIESLFRAVEAEKTLSGTYPETFEGLAESGGFRTVQTKDPWGRPYRLVVRGGVLLITGSNAEGRATPRLLVGRRLADERRRLEGRKPGPGLILVE